VHVLSSSVYGWAWVPDVKHDSSEGRALSSRILAKCLPYKPHNYQLDGICPIMDGFDLLVTTPTGLGKTGYLIMLMLVVREISADTALAPLTSNSSRLSDNPESVFLRHDIDASRVLIHAKQLPRFGDM